MYKIISANTNLETLKNFVKKENRKVSRLEGGGDSDFRNKPLNNALESVINGNPHVHMVCNDTNIISIISSLMEEEIHLLKIIYVAQDADITDVYKAFAEMTNVVIAGDKWSKKEAAHAGFTICNNVIGTNRINLSHMGTTFYTNGNPDAILNQFKKEFLDIEMGKISYRVFTSSEMDNYMMDTYMNKSEFWMLPTLINNNNQSRFPGFHYFNFNDANRHNDKIKYLCALIEGKIVGVIKFGVWPLSPDHQSVSFIDVHMALRGHGIASMMIKELDKYLDPTIPFHLTQESEMGRKCNMARVFKENIKSTKCYSYQELSEMAIASMS